MCVCKLLLLFQSIDTNAMRCGAIRCDPSAQQRDFTIFNDCNIINLCMELFRLHGHNFIALCYVLSSAHVVNDGVPIRLRSVRFCNVVYVYCIFIATKFR